MIESVIIGIVTVSALVWMLTDVLGGITRRDRSTPAEPRPIKEMKRAA
jgi:hypothetical protein